MQVQCTFSNFGDLSVGILGTQVGEIGALICICIAAACPLVLETACRELVRVFYLWESITFNLLEYVEFVLLRVSVQNFSCRSPNLARLVVDRDTQSVVLVMEGERYEGDRIFIGRTKFSHCTASKPYSPCYSMWNSEQFPMR